MLEWVDSFQDLSDEELGILFRNFISYHTGGEIDTSSHSVNLIWKLLVKQIDRINNKYQKNSENGKNGGRPKKPTETQENPMGLQENRTVTELEPKKSEVKANRNRTKSYKEKEKEKEKDNILTSELSSNLSSGEKSMLERLKQKFLNDGLSDEESIEYSKSLLNLKTIEECEFFLKE